MAREKKKQEPQPKSPHQEKGAERLTVIDTKTGETKIYVRIT